MLSNLFQYFLERPPKNREENWTEQNELCKKKKNSFVCVVYIRVIVYIWVIVYNYEWCMSHLPNLFILPSLTSDTDRYPCIQVASRCLIFFFFTRNEWSPDIQIETEKVPTCPGSVPGSRGAKTSMITTWQRYTEKFTRTDSSVEGRQVVSLIFYSNHLRLGGRTDHSMRILPSKTGKKKSKLYLIGTIFLTKRQPRP